MDDLQWATPDSIELMSVLLNASPARLLFIGTFRDEEGMRNAALRQALATFNDSEKSHFEYHHIHLEQLGTISAKREEKKKAGRGLFLYLPQIFIVILAKSDVEELVSDALQIDCEYAAPLATVICQKTSGNPLFASQFISELYRQSYIEYKWYVML